MIAEFDRLALPSRLIEFLVAESQTGISLVKEILYRETETLYKPYNRPDNQVANLFTKVPKQAKREGCEANKMISNPYNFQDTICAQYELFMFPLCVKNV